MKELYLKYFHILLHPIDSLNDQSKDTNILPLDVINNNKNESHLTLTEVILLSWPFYFLSVVYNMLYNTFFHIYFKNFSVEHSLISEISSLFRTYFILYDNFSLLFKFVFFPMILLFYLKIWQFIISLTTEIISPDQSKKNTEQIVIHSFVSHSFLIIPIFGPFLTFLAHIFYIFLGLRKSLKINRTQALFIVSSPLLLLLTFFFAIILLYSMLFVLS